MCEGARRPVVGMRRQPCYSCNATRRVRNAAATWREPNDCGRQAHRSMISAELAIHLQGAVMNSKVSMMKSMVVAVALAAGVSGIARADDSSMNPFTGDSYAYFNNGDLPRGDKPVFDKSASTWRQANPKGVPERQLESLSSEALANDFQRSTFDKGPSAWREAHPNGVSERELQAESTR